MIYMKPAFRKFLEVIRKRYLLPIMFFVVLELRLFFAFQTMEFSDDSAYETLRQIENIKETGLPIFNDKLSYYPENTLHSPIFHYVLAFFNLFLPVRIVAKIIPNIFASLIVFVVYLIGYKLTRDINASLFSAFLSGFVPIFFIETINSVSVYSMVVPLVLYGFYSFFMISTNDKYIFHFILTIAILSFTHASVFIVLFALVLYVILMRSESIETKHVEIEVIIVSAFLVLWSQFLIYKNAFLTYGLDVIRQNVPSQLLSSIFSRIDLLSAIYLIGTIPVFFGVHTLYQYILEKKSRYMFFFLSYALPIFFLLWFKLITPTTGLIFLGVVLVVIASKYFHEYMIYIDKSKFARYKLLIISLMIFAFGVTTFLPTITLSWEKIYDAPQEDFIIALEHINEISERKAIVLSSIREAQAVRFYAQRKTFLDMNFLSVPEVDEKLEDYEEMYSTSYEIDALRLLNKYNINYILFTPSNREELNIDKIAYVSDESCFDNIFNKNGIEIYQVLCKIEEYG